MRSTQERGGETRKGREAEETNGKRERERERRRGERKRGEGRGRESATELQEGRGERRGARVLGKRSPHK